MSNNIGPGSSKKALEISFERPPFFKELKPFEKEFNNLKGEYRHLIKRLVETQGDLYLSLQDAGLLDLVEKKFDLALPDTTSVHKAMDAHGIHWDFIFTKMKEIALGLEKKLDGKGNVVEVQNHNAQLKALVELIKLLQAGKSGDNDRSLAEVEQLFKNTKV